MKFRILILTLMVNSAAWASTQTSVTLCGVTIPGENVITKPADGLTLQFALQLYRDTGNDIKTCSLGGSAVLVFKKKATGSVGAIIF